MSLLELKNISKSFGTNQVLDRINFTLEAGTIHALIGENGAGKSTLLNIIGGLYKPDEGQIFINDKEIKNNSIQVAKENGIGFVHQELELCQDVTVAENIMMAKICDSKKMMVDYDKVAEEAEKILEPLVGSKINPKALVSSLSVSDQQIVEIAKALSYNCRILLLDEPTAALSENGTEALFNVVRKLANENIGIIFISHRMSELFEFCDKVTVLRDGKIISTYKTSDANVIQLTKDMAGREISDIYPPKAQTVHRDKEHELLRVENLCDAKDRFRNISFSLYQGEVLGVAGLVGAGRTEIMQDIVNLRKRKSGHVYLAGENIDNLPTDKIYKKGLVLMSEDRKKSGLFLDYSVKRNICSTFLEQVSQGMFINAAREKKLANEKIEELSIKTMGPEQSVQRLSGGNQQKVLLGKLLAKTPRVVILDEPTKGVDAVAKMTIGEYIRKLVNNGIGVILITSEMNELIGLCDRLIFIDIDGDQVKEEVKDEFNSDTIVYYISGAYKYEEARK